MNQSELSFPQNAEPSTVQHISAQAEVHRDGSLRVLMVCGIPLMTWSEGDKVSEHYSMVLLVRLGVASQIQVATAFGVARMTVNRVEERFDRGGICGLHLKRGRQGPIVLRDVATRRMLALKKAGVANVQIAARLGVTEAGIRKALIRVGYKAPSATQADFTTSVPEGAERSPSEAPSPSVGPTPPVMETAGNAAPARIDDVMRDPNTAALAAPLGSDDATPAPGAAVEQAPPLPGGQAVSAVAPTAPLTSAPPPAVGQAGILHGVDPWDRSLERALAPTGLIGEAAPLFGDCQGVAGLGVLLALPALVNSGMLDIASRSFMGWSAAFYGVRTVFLCLALMALQRIRNPEQLRHHRPVDLGRVLGLDRAPEVKTLRAKVESLSTQHQSETFMRELAKRRVEARPDAMGFLYVDGHVRVYNGKTELGKMHVTRIRLSMPATADHWVNDRDGDPLLVITATPTAALAKEMLSIATEVRQALGQDRRATVIFDRGGWSPELFAKLIAMGFDILTYRKGRIPKVRRSKFKLHEGVFDGRTVKYQLAERTVRFKYHGGGVLVLREVVRLSDDGEHQTSIVTNRKDLSAVEVAYRMFERWRQENFFKYMQAEFGIDALWTYGTENADAEREVPNPERKDKERDLLEARAEVARLERLLGAAAADNHEATRPSMRGFKIANGKVGRQLREARKRVTQLRTAVRDIPKRVTAAEAANGKPVVRLKTETKRLTDTIKSVAYQAETALFRMVRPHYTRVEDEGRKLIASALDLPGDIHVAQGELRIILAPAASPNRTLALARLCEELTATNTIYPGTQLRVSYAIRDA